MNAGRELDNYLLEKLNEMLKEEAASRSGRWASEERAQEIYKETCEELVEYLYDKVFRYQE
jgi:hypothetical protein